MNYLLFICDDLEHDDFACLGTKTFTPNIDRLAREGQLLKQHYCGAAVCTPSRWEYLTGQYAMRCKSDAFIDHPDTKNTKGQTACIGWNTWIDGSTPTIAHHLKNTSHKTAFFGKWHTGPEFKHLCPPHLSPDSNPEDPEVEQSLKAIQEQMVEQVCRDGGFDHAAAVTSGNREACPLKALNRHHNPEWATDAAIQWLDDIGPQQDFHMHFATTLPHGDAPNEEIDLDPRQTVAGRLNHIPFGAEKRKTIRRRLEQAGIDPYDHRALAMLSIDDQLGALLDKLDEMGIAEQTVVLMSCDHNVEPGKGSVYQEGVHIPGVVKWPGLTRAGSQQDAAIMNVDWTPTFLADAGVAIPKEMDGVDLRPLLAQQVTSARDHLFFNMGFHRAISDGQHKLVYLRYPEHAIERMKDPNATEAVNFIDMPTQGQACIVTDSYPHAHDPNQLYDLVNDPDEQHNLYEDPNKADIVSELSSKLQRLVESVPDFPFDINNTEFIDTPRFKTLVKALRQRSAGACPWWPAGKFPFKDGDRWL